MPSYEESRENGNPESVGLPIKMFFYTLDQVGGMLSLSQKKLKETFIHFEGRSLGARHPSLLRADNISPTDGAPEWRVSEKELIRWLKWKKIRFVHRGWVK